MAESEKQTVENFLNGYPIAMRQLDAAISQAGDTQASLQRIKLLTDALRLANTYISEVADDNARIEGVIENLRTISTREE